MPGQVCAPFRWQQALRSHFLDRAVNGLRTVPVIGDIRDKQIRSKCNGVTRSVLFLLAPTEQHTCQSPAHQTLDNRDCPETGEDQADPSFPSRRKWNGDQRGPNDHVCESLGLANVRLKLHIASFIKQRPG